MERVDVQIKNGRFVNFDGMGSPNRIQVLGWTCTILHNGCEESRKDISLFCTKIDGNESFRYTVSYIGYSKLTRRSPQEGIVTLSSGYVLNRGVRLSDGTLQIFEKEIAFKDEWFNNFLKSFGIDKMVLLRVNDYNWREKTVKDNDGKIVSKEQYFLTDGIKEEISRQSKPVSPTITKEVIEYSVPASRWLVLCESDEESGTETRTLFTLIHDAREIKMALQKNPSFKDSHF